MSMPVTPSRFVPPPSPSPSPMRQKRQLIEQALPRPSVQQFIDKVIEDLLEQGKIQAHERGIHNPKVLKNVQKEGIRQNLQDVFAWMLTDKLPITASAYSAAAEKGDLATFQLLLAHKGALTAKCSRSAALHNQFDFLKKAGKLPMDATACAASVHNLDMLKWLRQNKCPWDSLTTAEAAAGGHLDALAWALNNQCPIDNRALNWAVHDQQKEAIELLLARGVKWSEESLLLATMEGNIAGVALARSLGCPWNRNVCIQARDVETLKWLREKGCPWDEGVCNHAAALGNFPLLQWAIANQAPIDPKIYEITALEGHLHILQWLVNHTSVPFKPKKILKIAQETGHDPIVQWIERMLGQFNKKKSSGKKRKEPPAT